MPGGFRPHGLGPIGLRAERRGWVRGTGLEFGVLGFRVLGYRLVWLGAV